jgi:dihydrofolate reductase
LKIIIIAAIAKNRVIGRKDGEMSWHVKEEFQHFKETTFGSAIIMGRKTYETLGKPLKGRENIIITRDKNYATIFNDVQIFNSLQASLDYFMTKGYDKIFIIGGGEIFKQALPIADEMILSFMKFDAEGEVLFPEFKENEWRKISSEDRGKFEIVRFIKTDDKTN